MFLIIDTANIEYIYLGLGKESQVEYEQKIPAKFEQEEKLLVSLDKFVKDNNLELVDLSGIITVNGPGSFSALRIGLAVGNTLAWSLNKKIVGFNKNSFSNYQDLLKQGILELDKIDDFKIVLPEYGAEPNINK